MINGYSKAGRLRLDSGSYQRLCRRVLERDAWRCQNCGSLRALHVHHCEFRSHSGSDIEENLITLCDQCHRDLHAYVRLGKSEY
jgi:5-methylcytosine-specific restriction endonuclease McrA